MENVTIKTGRENMNIEVIHKFLSEESYWVKGISYALVDNSLRNSYCVGAFVNDQQVGFGRVITDYYTFGWLADFMVLPEYQGKGVAKEILSHILGQDWAKRLRRIMLNTMDAHTLYQQFGFQALNKPENLMEISRPHVHLEWVDDILKSS